MEERMYFLFSDFQHINFGVKESSLLKKSSKLGDRESPTKVPNRLKL
jgi:hypothetical protein